MRIAQRLKEYFKLMRFNKPVGIYLLLWPTLCGLCLAGQGKPSVKITLIFIAGVILTRAMGCVINDIADRHLDPHVERTKMRPLAARTVSTAEAIILFIILAALALALVCLLNKLTIILAIIGVLISIVYPFLKRYVHWPQFVLAIVFGAWPVLMSYAALQEHFPLDCWLFAAGCYFWQVSYDTMYAMSDKEDDIKIGIKSAAILFGKRVQNWIAFFQSLAVVGWVSTAYYLNLHLGFYLLLIAVVLLMIHEQRLIKSYQRQACFKAFLHNQWVGLLLFVAVLLSF